MRRWPFYVAALFAASTAHAEMPPALGVRFVSPNTIEVKGLFFPIHEAIQIELDISTPHASVACQKERTVTALTNPDGQFTVQLSPAGACAVRCDDTDTYLILATTRRGAVYAVLVPTEDACP